MADNDFLVVDNLTSDERERIFSKIAVDLETGCWNWTASRNDDGYGRIGFRGVLEQAHRIMYALFFGPIPKGTGPMIPNIDHVVCNNPSCCNPYHLVLTTPRNNTLRGNAPPAINSRKTHCSNGHLLPTVPNTSDGKGRRCKICQAVYDRARDRTEYHREYMRGYRKRKRVKG